MHMHHIHHLVKYFMQNINVVDDKIKVKQKYNNNCSRPFAPNENKYLILNQYLVI